MQVSRAALTVYRSAVRLRMLSSCASSYSRRDIQRGVLLHAETHGILQSNSSPTPSFQKLSPKLAGVCCYSRTSPAVFSSSSAGSRVKLALHRSHRRSCHPSSLHLNIYHLTVQFHTNIQKLRRSTGGASASISEHLVSLVFGKTGVHLLVRN